MSFIYFYAFIFSHSLAFCHIYFLLLFFFLWHSWLHKKGTPPQKKRVLNIITWNKSQPKQEFSLTNLH